MPRFIILDGGTIRDSREEDNAQRLRKRKRLEDDSDNNRPSLRTAADGAETLINDQDYYFTDDPQAECYVRVEKILFKIHSHRLVMSKMLAARLRDRPVPSSSKEPLELFGVSVEEFRALLWARYASEEDAKDQPRTLEDLRRLLYLSTVTRNFEFGALHEWGMQSMHRAFTSDAVLADTCSSATFTRVIEIATQYKADDLLEAAVSKWVERIQRRDIPAVPAMLAGDAHRLPRLCGVSYYAHLLESIEHSPAPSLFRLQADPRLSDTQLIRLLSGHVSLVNYTEQYRRRPAKLHCADGCSAEAHRACTVVWGERWLATAGSRKMLVHNSADILGIVSTMCELLTADSELGWSLRYLTIAIIGPCDRIENRAARRTRYPRGVIQPNIEKQYIFVLVSSIGL
ncbi:hypothetical protein LshimejAT787_0505430 [Lyophyllum shimeji]|uniref:BTB domain-containing protein n=1 Tax=Lyophyllum shimeji TaxID=47721 RepID=A0A9P3UMI1_LYOSH|nr:hypothetical protein LshimejAT787_0505430 [Lyophyllum shimeji]